MEEDTLITSIVAPEYPYDRPVTYTLTGTNFVVNSRNTVKPQVILISDNGTEYKSIITTYFFTSNGVDGSFVMYMPYAPDIPEGKYKIKVVNYSKAVTLSKTVQIVHQTI